jgi:type II secretory pathway pseudopilin PulG
MEKPADRSVMMLRSQDGERGYAMAALLVALAIMAILMSVALPVWRQEARREKEAELVFRGEQYARAIALFKFKNANIPNAFPPSIDFLVQNRFLRKKYKDPMTKDGEFVLIGGGSQQPGLNSPGRAQPGQSQPPQTQTGGRSNPPAGGRSNPPVLPGVQPTVPAAGMIGVRSASTETSIRTYRGATRYDQWQFTFNIAPRPGGAMPMANSPEGGGNNPNNPNVPGGGRNPGRGNRGNPGFNPNRPTTAPPPVGTPGGNRGSNPAGRGRGLF